MSGWLRLAWRHICYYRYRTATLVACVYLTCCLPLLLGVLLQQFNQRIAQRAASTPLVIGGKGSSLDLTLHALYFSAAPQSAIQYGEHRSLSRSGEALSIPIHARFTARRFPLVGTSLDYFKFRKLELDHGRMLAVLGDCILGAEVARNLNLVPGNFLLSDRENMLDIAGLYPLKMRVVGVLKPNRSADDRAVFVDIKTAWVIEGLGHGHEDVAKTTDEGKILYRDDHRVVANAAVLPYTEITPENVGSFHFHGDLDDFPVTALVVRARDQKTETILIGRYASDRSNAQIVIPRVVIDDLMALVFQIKRFFDANSLLVSLATAFLLALVISLSLRLRAGEMLTMFKLGCSRRTILMIIAGELTIVACLAAVLIFATLLVTQRFGPEMVERWFVS